MDRFPGRMFRWAAVYGVIVLLPLYFAPLPAQGGEISLRFIGLALVFQGVFWIIGGNPRKYRALMLPAVAEKLIFAVPVMALVLRGYPIMPVVAMFAGVDMVLGLGFFVAWRRTRHAGT